MNTQNETPKFNGFFPEFVKGKLEKAWFLKMYHDTSWGVLATPLSVLGNFMTFSVFLKIFDLWNPIFIAIAAMLYISFTITFGYHMYKRTWVQRINTFNNKFNQELQELLRNTNVKKEKEN